MTDRPADMTYEPSAALRAAFHDGDPAAIGELADGFYVELCRYCGAIVGDPDSAGEAVQEAFLRLLERHRQYDPTRPLRPWLFGIARHCSLEALRRAATRAARVVSVEPTDHEIADQATDAPSALELLLRDEREGAALGALARLPENARLVVAMHLFEDLAFREIGEALGRPTNTVAAQYYRALDSLRATLVEDAPRRSRRAS